MVKTLAVTFMLLLLLVFPGHAEETIVKFDSDVTVNSDASLDVIEAISVLSDGTTIRHGIFRDFPTRYVDRHGFAKRVDFDVQSVTRNSQSENYTIEAISGGKRIKIGDKDIQLQPGIHKYIIRYHTARQLGFYDVFDELYWNVTGNGWPYSIQNAVVKIHLPSGAIISKTALYTGIEGSNASDAAIDNLTGNNSAGNYVSARATRVLNPREGMTIAVNWQKGIVVAPTQQQQQLWMLRDNAGTAGLVATLLTVFFYYLYAWNKVGRDPPGGTIIPLFHPPADLGPAGVGYVWKQEFDDQVMAASLIGLAVKGGLKIENQQGVYALTRLDAPQQNLTPSEATTYRLLPASRIALSQSNNVTIRVLKSGLESFLSKTYQGALFVKNLGWLTVGIIMSIVGLALSAYLSPDPMGMTGLFAGTFATVIWSIILSVAWASVKGVMTTPGLFGKLKSLMGLIFIVPFLGAGIAVPVSFYFSEGFSPTLIAFVGATMLIGVINLVFSFLMPAPTLAGRRVLDAIEGFRLYMTTAEEKRLDALNPPEKTPELFERYLPYAMALDCENAWGAKFAAVLAAAAATGTAGAAWYLSSGRSSNGWGGITNGLGRSLASTLSASSVAPGSSSGSSGGSSGGGGGGGGGGGW